MVMMMMIRGRWVIMGWSISLGGGLGLVVRNAVGEAFHISGWYRVVNMGK
jgi:hypothetical protein